MLRLFALLLALGGCHGQVLLDATPLDMPSLGAVSAVVVADPEGDGDGLVVAASGGTIVAISADGVETTIASGLADIYSLAAADVTGDGYPELIVGCETYVTVLVNSGGTWTGATQDSFSTSAFAAAVTVSDIDLDGNADISYGTATGVVVVGGSDFDLQLGMGVDDPVVAMAAAGTTVVVATGTELRTYTTSTTWQSTNLDQTTTFQASALRVANATDFAAAQGATVSWFKVDSLAVSRTQEAEAEAQADIDDLELLDVDLDGDLDVVVLAGGNVTWLGGQPEQPLASLTLEFDTLRVGDLDGDGFVELVATSSTNASAPAYALAFLPPAAPASLAANPSITGPVVVGNSPVNLQLLWSPPASDNGALVTMYTITPGGYPAFGSSMSLALPIGFTGTYSVAAVNAYGTGPSISIDVALTAPLETVLSDYGLELSGTAAVEAADFDLDGALDLAVANDTTVYLVSNNGTVRVLTQAVAGARSLCVADDLDGDGFPDVVVPSPGTDELHVLFSGKSDLVVAAAGLVEARVGDVNGDGETDIVVALQDDVVYFAGPDFEAQADFLDGATCGPNGMALDADVGVVLLDWLGSIVQHWRYDGTLAMSWTATDLFPRAIAAGDLDGDGAVDFAFTSKNLDTVYVLSNDGQGALAEPSVLASVEGPLGIAIGDLNLDGSPDVVVASRTTDELIDLDSGLTLAMGLPDPFAVALADMDGDGDLDVVTAGGGLSLALVQTAPFAPAALAVDEVAVVSVGSPASVSVTLSWDPPASDNGAPVTMYAVYPGGYNTTATNMTLSNATAVLGETYTFSVAAVNYRGEGPAAAVDVTPTAPVEVRAVALTSSVADTLRDVDIGDLNRDGVPDVVVAASGSSGSISWFDGASGAEHIVSTAVTSAYGVCVADVDADGLLDVVASSRVTSGELHIFSNASGPASVISVGNGPLGVRFGDVDGDGVGDFVFTEFYDNRLVYVTVADTSELHVIAESLLDAYYLELGDMDADGGPLDIAVAADAGYRIGLFRDLGASPTLLTGLIAPKSVRMGDVDGDGLLDLVTTDNNNVVLFPSGSAYAETIIAEGVESVFDVALGDFDLDGDVDVVATALSGDAVVLIRQEAGGDWAEPVTLHSIDEPRRVAMADFDLDGDLDVVVVGGSDSVVQLFVETVPFAPADVQASLTVTGPVLADTPVVELTLEWTPAQDNGAPVTLYVVNEEKNTTATSLLLDRLLTLGVSYEFEVAAANYRGTGPAATIDVTPTSPVELVATELSTPGISGPTTLVAADMNLDGVPDVVAPGYSSHTVAWYDGATGEEHMLLTATGDFKPFGACVADLDSDGLPDVATAGTYLHVFFSNSSTEDVAVPLSSGGDRGVIALDVTNDGVLDLVVAHFWDNDILVFAGPSFTSSVALDTPGLSNPYLLHAADLDGDGRPEIIVPSNGNRALYVINGATLEMMQLVSGLGEYPTAATSADVDGDGDIDVFMATFGGGTVRVFFNDGTGALSYSSESVVVTPDVTGATTLAVADFDLDGDPDVVVGTAHAGYVLLVLNEGGGREWAAPIQLLVDYQPEAVAAADFDLDGDMDIVAGKWSVWKLLIGAAPFAPTGVSAVGLLDSFEVNVSWVPAADNGALVTDYLVNGTSVGAGRSWVVLNSSSTFDVAAVNWRGVSTAATVPYDACFDGVRNAGESDVDCGASSLECGLCAGGARCAVDGDCLNGECLDSGVCASCFDGLQNQDETSVDCGGWWCGPCLSCSGVDNGVEVSWDAVPGAEGYWTTAGVMDGRNATVDGLPNYAPATVTVAALPGGVNGTCEATPLPEFVALVVDVSLDQVAFDGVVVNVTAGTAAALGDLNGDGELDLVLGAGSRLVVLKGPEFATALSSVSLPAPPLPSVVFGTTDVLAATASGDVYLCPRAVNCSLVDDFVGTAVAVCDAYGTVVAVDSSDGVTVDGVDAGLTVATGTTATCYAEGVVALGSEQLLTLVAHPEPPVGLAVELLTLSTANVTWAPPDEDGGVAVTSYVVSGGVGQTGRTAAALEGLEGGETYVITVSAVNDVGESMAAAVEFAMPVGNVSVTSTPVAGQAAVHWSLPVAYASVRVDGREGLAPPYVADGLNCSLHGFEVVFVDDVGDELVGSGRMEVPPIGVCPGMCSALPIDGAAWIDPTLADPFNVECDGNWTIGAFAVLDDLSSHTRLTYANGSVRVVEATGVAVGPEVAEVAVKTDLRVVVDSQPAAIVAHAVNVSAEIVAEPNAIAAELWMRLDGGAWVQAVGLVEAEGPHTLELMATLDPWLTSPVVTVEWESDYTAPTTDFSPEPAAYEASDEAVFGLAASEGSVVFQYCLDGVTCGSQASVESGSEVLPSTFVGTAPQNPVASPLSLNVTSDLGTSFAVSTDEGPWAVTDLSSVSLSDGWHSLQVRAVDSDGDVDPSPLAFGLAVGGDRWAPDTFVSGGDGAYYLGSTVALELSVDEDGCTFEYSVDSGSSWAAVGGETLELVAETVGAAHAFVRAIDAAGNVDPIPAAVGWSVLLPETWFVNASTTAEGTGVGVEYSLDQGASWSAAVVDVSADGTYVVLARAVDALGNVDPSPAILPLTVGDARLEWALAPAAESPFAMAVFAVSQVETSGCELEWSLDGGSAAGAVGDDGVFVAGPLLLGLHSVEVSADGCGLSLDHQWTVTAESSALEVTFAGLSEGVHTVQAYATDLVDNVGPVRSHNWTVDLTAPETVLSGSDLLVTRESAVELNVSCVDPWGCRFNVSVDGEAWGLQDSPLVLEGLLEGSRSIVVTAVDLAGNVAANSLGVTVYVDTTPPVVALAGANITNAPSFAVSCSDLSGCASVDLFVDGSSVGNLTGLTGLDDGPHVARAEATDGALNVAVVELAFTVDTVRPETVYGGPAAVMVNSSSVDLNVSCTDTGSVCWVESSVALEGLAEGVHVVELWAEDEAGNVDDLPVVVNVTVDTVPPVVSHVGESQSGQTVTLELDCDDSTGCLYHVSAPTAQQVDGLAVTAADGNHGVLVEVVDGAGNVGSPLLLADTLFDSVAPELTITSQPADYVPSSSSDVEWVASDDHLIGCECDGVTCTSPFPVRDAAEGVAGVQIICSDIRDNAVAANVSWVVDWTPPETDITTAVPVVTNESSWTIAFEVDDANPTTASCRLTGPLSVVDDDCVSPFVVDLGGDGTYAVNVSATDAAANTGLQDGVVFRLDTAAPVITVSEQPESITTVETSPVEFGCTKEDPDNVCGARVEDTDCTLSFSQDDGPWQSTATGQLAVTATTLNELTTVVVRATDSAGNVGVETVEWTWTDAAVATAFASGPPPSTNLYSFAFAWNTSQALDEEPVFESKLDDGAWQVIANVTATGSGTYAASFSVADEGPHTLSVAVQGARDDADTWPWTVEHCAAVGEIEDTGPAGGLVCEDCPPGADCDEGKATVAPGWWWSQPLGTEIRADSVLYECRVEAACTGNWTAAAGLCAEGYEGVVCDTCSPGFGRTLELECQPCGASDNSGIVALAATLFSLGLTVVAVFIVKRSLSTTSTARAVSTLKIMANYFLMMGILKDMDLDWGGMLTKMFSYMGVASGSGAADVQLVNCVARVDTFDQFWLYFSIPVLLVVAPAVALWGYAGARRLKWVTDGRVGGELGSARIWGHSKAFVYRQALLVLAYFAYPVIVTASFKALHCTDIEGESRLVLDYSKLCSGAEYAPIFVIGLLYATVVALGVPFGVYLAMRRHHATLTTAGKAQTQFFFFFGEFRMERYWWEMTVMARKVAMGAIAVLLNNHEQKMQVYVGTWLLLFSFTAQITNQPHKDVAQRNLETVAQGTVLASLLLGQGMAFENVTHDQRQAFQLCVLVLNVAVMNGMGLMLGWEGWKEAKDKLRPVSVARGGKAQQQQQVELPTMSSGTPEPVGRFETQNPMLRP